MKERETLEATREAIRNERYADAVPLATNLVEAGDPWNIPGYLYRAMAYENGCENLNVNIEMAISDYRMLVSISPTMETHLYLANALMARGEEGLEMALHNLREAEKLGTSPGLDLAFARFYEESDRPSLDLACSHYCSAAMAGRFLGFFGVSRVLRKMGRPTLALFVDVIRYIFGPFIALLVGKKAQHRF